MDEVTKGRIQYYIEKGEGMNGRKSHRVRALQEMLFYLGFLTSAPDGQFWLNTERAVRKAQQYFGFDDTGIVDVDFLCKISQEVIYKDPNEK